MTVKDTAGTVKTKAAVQALMTDVTPTSSKVFTFNGSGVGDGTLRDAFIHPGLPLTAEANLSVAFIPGQKYTQAQIDAHWATGTITSITPATGLAAGGLAVVIKGTGFFGATSVTFGGTVGTSFSVVNDTTINVTTPAKSAGTYDVVVVDDSGSITKTAGFVYT